MSNIEIRGATGKETTTLKIRNPECSPDVKSYTQDAHRLAKFLWDNIPSGTFDLMLEDLNYRAEGAQTEITNLIGEYVRR